MERTYVPAGGVLRGSVALTVDANTPAGAVLRIQAVRCVEVPDAPNAPAGRRTEKLLDKPVSKPEGKGSAQIEVPFEAPAAGMLFGTIRVEAELLAGDGRRVSLAAGPSVSVGVRPRIDLGGDWQVAAVKVFDGDMPQRKKDWKMPALPATVALPGELPLDEGYRGWLTLKRAVTWKAQAGGNAGAGALRPRFVFVDGASDSAAITIDGAAVGETAPADEYACLTHWLEFHCPFKGPENRDKRYLLMAGGFEYPCRFPLPKALPAEGSAQVEMVLRSTSGGIMGNTKPPYGVLNGLRLDLAGDQHIRAVSFDASKPGEMRRFTFRLQMGNDGGKEFRGRLRCVYGRYDGRLPYSGDCPAFATAEQDVTIPPGGAAVEVARDEVPRFDTCRATFLLLNAAGKVLDADQQNYHTVVVEIRDRRDVYLNNERFIVKFHGGFGEDHATRLQAGVKGGNGFRGHRNDPSPLVRGFQTAAACLNSRYADGQLTSAGGALLASCEKCTFWDPKDTSNIYKAVRGFVRQMGPCPGILEWEATNELHGEPEEARVEILKAFRQADPYHRPVMATKGSGEWEAEAHDGRVAGVDIVGCQYLLSAEATDSIVAAVTEQPVMSTEVNWNDDQLTGKGNLFEVWLNKGLCGSLLFDYSGSGLTQAVPLIPPADNERDGSVIRQSNRSLYQDLTAVARRQADGRVLVTVGNRMPYALRGVVLHAAGVGRFDLGDLASGDAADVLLPPAKSPPPREPVPLRAAFTTHGGLKHLEILTPIVEPAPAAPAAARKGGAK